MRNWSYLPANVRYEVICKNTKVTISLRSACCIVSCNETTQQRIINTAAFKRSRNHINRIWKVQLCPEHRCLNQVQVTQKSFREITTGQNAINQNTSSPGKPITCALLSREWRIESETDVARTPIFSNRQLLLSEWRCSGKFELTGLQFFTLNKLNE
jgi:hypothetical protein